MMKNVIVVILFFALAVNSYSQDSWIDNARKKLHAAKDDRQKFIATRNLFYAYVYSFPDSDSALAYLKQSMLLARKLRSDTAIAQVYVQYSANALVTGNYPVALQYGFEALKFAERTGYFLIIADTYGAIADVYFEQSDYKRAIFYLKKSIAISEQHYTMPSVLPSANNDSLETYTTKTYKLAETYVHAGELDSALKYISITEFGWSWAKVKFPQLLYVYGNIYDKKGDHSEAIRYYHEGIASAISYNIKKDLIDIYNALAGTYHYLQRWDSSIYYCNKVLEASQATKYPIGELKAIKLLAGAYKVNNNIDSTSKYFELALAVNDSLFNQDKLSQLQTIGFNEQLRQQDIEEAEQKKTYRFRIYTLAAGALFLLIILIVLYRSNKEKQKAKASIEKSYTELKATQQQLIQSEKMASLGELTAGIAHEIQNPLNFVNNFSEVNNELIDEAGEEIDKGNISEAKVILSDIKENGQKINHHGKRADAIVKGMLQHSRSSTAVKEPTDINKLADEYLRLAYHGLRAKDKSFNVTQKTDFDESIGKINVIPQDIGRTVLNLITNAFYAVGEKTRQAGNSYEPAVSITTMKIGNKLEITVKDNGNGIPPKVLDKIFQPFFTTKPTGQGTGLGLSLAYDIVKAHGGEIKVETKEGEGTEFVITLPVK